MFEKWPTTLNIELSTACNAACPQCARYNDDDDKGNIIENPNVPQHTLTLNEVQSLLDHQWLKQAKHIKIEGTHGEPTMSKDCADIIKWFREINPDVTLALHTNGSTRTADWWQDIAKFFQYSPVAVSRVIFSLDGLEDTNHIYRRRTVWSKIMENVKAFIQAGGVATWDMLVFEHNEHQVLQARKLAKSMGFYSFGVKVTQRNLSRPISWLRQPRTWKESTGTGKLEINCIGQQLDELYLNANGFYMPCCFINENYYGPHMPTTRKQTNETLGNIDQYHASRGIDNALNLFRKVSDRWNNDPLKICQDMCGNGRWPYRLHQRKTQEIWLDRFEQTVDPYGDQ